ncbi:MAG: DsrE family protein [Thiotrichales bacterium]
MLRFKLVVEVLLFALLSFSSIAWAEEEMRFPGDPAEHKIVYQYNKADLEYQEHILNSVSAMLGKYGDNVEIAIVAIGPGIHILAKNPKRDVPELMKQRAKSMAENYGVRWIACGNTMKTIGWEMDDMEPYAEYAEVGAASLMELQEQGFAYIAW